MTQANNIKTGCSCNIQQNSNEIATKHFKDYKGPGDFPSGLAWTPEQMIFSVMDKRIKRFLEIAWKHL